MLKQLKKKIKPDLTYTMSGPAYVKFKSFHVMGCSNPYITHAKLDAFLLLRNPVTIIKTLARVIYQSIYIRKADYWQFQTISARDSFVRRHRIPITKTTVISNTCGLHFFNHKKNNKVSGKKIIFSPSAAYIHKNLEIIPDVINDLLKIIKTKDKNIDFEFQITLPTDSSYLSTILKKARKLNCEKYINNIGPFSVNNGPYLYCNSHLMFLPTLLETFSGSYLEAMATGTPIVTTNKDFAKDVCGSAALYFKPKDSKDAASKIFQILSDDIIKNNLIFFRL